MQCRTQTLLLDTAHESQICSQILRAVCTVDVSRSSLDPDTFGNNVSQWVNHCDMIIKNSEGATEQLHGKEDIRSRIALAFTEAIWALGTEWELDSAVESDERWSSEQLRYMEQTRVLVQTTKSLISSGVIDQDLAKERLDPDMLEQINVIPSASAFTRKYIRLNTALNFKQTKFNLICEQSEGFSKLVTLIQSTMAGIAPQQLTNDILASIHNNNNNSDNVQSDSDHHYHHTTSVVQALRSLSDLQTRIRCLLVDIQRLIGVFNIDPNRALDIILDCFMSSVRFYWAFYIALLDASPWCRSLDESRKLAQLVGWKLQFYINGPASDYKYTDELSTVAALLIAHKLICLSDIYPMLTPESKDASEMEYEEWCAKMKDQQSPSSGGNLLAMMGGLDDMGEGDKDEVDKVLKDSEHGGSEWENQHALLCIKLLSVGDAESALVYLKRFPYMARVHQQIADLVIRIIETATNEIYSNTECVKVPVQSRLRLKKLITVPQNDTAYGQNAWGMPLPKSQQPPTDYHAHASSYVLSPLTKRAGEVFFYEKFWQIDRSAQILKLSSISDVPNALAPWLNISFLRLHNFPSLLTRLIRICRYGLAHTPKEESFWIGTLTSWILPAFSFCRPSAGLSNELWLLVSMLPLAQRYEMYANWESVLTSGRPSLPAIPSAETSNADKTAEKPNILSMSMSFDDALDDVDIDSDSAMPDTKSAKPIYMDHPYVEIESLCQDVRRQVRSVMRRLSGDTVKLMGRQLCNLCHSTPTLSLKIILDQVCSYDNLVDSVVEAFRYLTPLDSDVMFYIILKIIDDPASVKIKEDGVNAAHWLQSLSSFIAAYSHRHENPRLDVIMDYVLKRTISMVRTEDAPPVFDLTILSDTILRLAAIDVMANATDDQVLALQGGHFLQLEAFSMVSPWSLPQSATVDTVLAAGSDSRLTRRLTSWLTAMFANNDMALSFAVAMCTHADKVLNMSSLSLSNVLVIYDREIERVYQLFHLLNSNLKPEKYTKLIPGPHVLVAEYGLSWGLAVLWGRPTVSIALINGLKQWEEEGEHVEVEIVEQELSEINEDRDMVQVVSQDKIEHTQEATNPGDTGSKDNRDPSRDAEVGDSDSKMDVDSEAAKSLPSIDVDELPRVVLDLKFKAPLLPRDYTEHIANTLPASVKDIGLSPEFVAVFWALTLYDIDVPIDRYKKDIDIQTNLIKRIEPVSKQSQSRTKTALLAQIKARASLTIDSLEKEMQEQKLHVSRIRKWLISQKDYWFCMAHEQRKLVTQAFLQHCIFPRAVLSASDASFCAKFLWMMHFPLATNKFSLMIVYDNIFSDMLSTILAAFTENEARNYAKFLNISLAYLAPLHASEAHYKERAVNPWRGLTGFQQHWRYERGYLPPRSRTIRQQMPANPESEIGDSKRIKPGSAMLSYNDFRTVMRKWQVNLTKAFISALDSERNDTVRNGILALREMQRSFPVISQYGRRILDKVNEIAASGAATDSLDSNKNIKVMATSYGAYLGMAKKNWIAESDYYPATTPRDGLLRSPQSGKAQSGTKQEIRESSKPEQRTASIASNAPDGGSTPKGDDYASTSGSDIKPERTQRARQRPSASRAISSEAVAAVAAATAAAATSNKSTAPESVTGASNSHVAIASGMSSRSTGTDGREDKPEAGSTGQTSVRDHDDKKHRGRDREGSWSHGGRDRDRMRGRQYEADSRNSPKPAEPDRRDSRSLRSSPIQHDRDDGSHDSHLHKRAREGTVSDSKLEPPRQRIATPANIAQHQKSPLSGPASSKLTNEEADRKRKELRAQLLKQQEEKQKQGQKQELHHVEQTVDKNAKNSSRNTSSRHGSRDSSQARELGAGSERERGDLKENGNRRDRRISAKYPETGGSGNSHQQMEQNAHQEQSFSRTSRGPRRQSHRGQISSPNAFSGGRQTKNHDQRTGGAALPGRKGGGPGSSDRQNGDGHNNGSRRGPKRGRGPEARDWDDGKRYRK
ncbi:THO2 plays a role in transcriptional elongation [Coemansia spiralis]|uniref:THO complex subunit 2 n=1 Tax=Coemansia spiralis TaxID=417178 RepID=A0A9W8GC73_9FUNG|nr:THO2 plays a role in transcriptional elongation [Coemansia spiralis]